LGNLIGGAVSDLLSRRRGLRIGRSGRHRLTRPAFQQLRRADPADRADGDAQGVAVLGDRFPAPAGGRSRRRSHPDAGPAPPVGDDPGQKVGVHSGPGWIIIPT
jgi:hypothetical protein